MNPPDPRLGMHPIDIKMDNIQKAKEMRNKSKIPRIRTMKKILKKIKESKRPKT